MKFINFDVYDRLKLLFFPHFLTQNSFPLFSSRPSPSPPPLFLPLSLPSFSLSPFAISPSSLPLFLPLPSYSLPHPFLHPQPTSNGSSPSPPPVGDIDGFRGPKSTKGHHAKSHSASARPTGSGSGTNGALEGGALEVTGEIDGLRLNPSKLHSATMTTPISSHAAPTTDTKTTTSAKKGNLRFSS